MGVRVKALQRRSERGMLCRAGVCVRARVCARVYITFEHWQVFVRRPISRRISPSGRRRAIARRRTANLWCRHLTLRIGSALWGRGGVGWGAGEGYAGGRFNPRRIPHREAAVQMS